MPMPKSNRKCSINGCDRKHQSRGWCKQHWQRWSRNGDPMAEVPFASAIKEFLKTAASFDDPANCRLWPFALQRTGYGVLTVDRKHYNAHHYVCILAHGPRPSERHEAAHNCGNPACVNPHHVRWATPAENAQDKIVHGTMPRGDAHCHRKISDADVVRIRDLAATVRVTKLAKQFNVSSATISGIVSGKHRKRPASAPLPFDARLAAIAERVAV